MNKQNLENVQIATAHVMLLNIPPYVGEYLERNSTNKKDIRTALCMQQDIFTQFPILNEVVDKKERLAMATKFIQKYFVKKRCVARKTNYLPMNLFEHHKEINQTPPGLVGNFFCDERHSSLESAMKKYDYVSMLTAVDMENPKSQGYLLVHHCTLEERFEPFSDNLLMDRSHAVHTAKLLLASLSI
ncbi:MAG TPA: hypothetical protein VL576_00840 [Candidatus Paceibacterota bacterium]|jgi:hypothetical protein|nr:hypothetical protein [Candidatus Paceibacterota bacterium]